MEQQQQNKKFDYDWVVGFIFEKAEYDTPVGLVEKTYPSWQAGKLNGAGGAVEPDDLDASTAMMREAGEEVGLYYHDWRLFCRMFGWSENRSKRFRLSYFYVFGNPEKMTQQTEKDIPVVICAGMMPENMIPNVRWLIPMALTMARGEENCPLFHVVEMPELVGPGSPGWR